MAAINLVVVFAAAAVGVVGASESAPRAVPEIRSISFEIRGHSEFTDEELRTFISLHETMPLDNALLDRDIRSLFKTELFDSIRVRCMPVSPEQVDLVFEMREKGARSGFRVDSIRIRGNKGIAEAKLWPEIPFKTGQVIDERRLRAITAHLEFVCRSLGYPQATVVFLVKVNAKTGQVAVTFKVNERGG